MPSNIYLLHFDPPYRHAGHYLGYTTYEDVADRLAIHIAGHGAVLVKAAVKAGSQVTLAKVWKDAPRKAEMKIKGRGLKVYCPLCTNRPREPRL